MAPYAAVTLLAVLALAAAPLQIAATNPAERSAWARRAAEMAAAGTLAPRRAMADTMVPGRVHHRYAQLHRGVPVLGGELVLQEEAGRTVSVLGTLFDGIDAATEPAIGPDRALDVVARATGANLGLSRAGPLTIVPLPDGAFRLAYPVRAFAGGELAVHYVDARTGAIAWTRGDLKRQAAPGTGTGVLGDAKKMSVRREAAGFVADDPLRPPSLLTFDMKGDVNKTVDFLNGVVDLRGSDLAADADNAWTDGAAVDGHTYAGWTYDYLFKRFGRRGLDDADLRILSLVHPVRREDIGRYSAAIVDVFYLNAFYAGDGIMVYGEGLPAGGTFQGQAFDYLAGGLDIVAHELAHGVTEYSSNLVYEGESGALNESFSDMMAAGVEFFFQPPGGAALQADYALGEDVIRPGGIRSMANPALFGDPDHYSRRYTGPLDGGGVHVNSSIPNHAFFLAIEGGVNRTSGLAVTGVGGARREEIEKAMYRAFVYLMPPRASFATARAATLQAARELYGPGSASERALAEAWTAVGVP